MRSFTGQEILSPTLVPPTRGIANNRSVVFTLPRSGYRQGGKAAQARGEGRCQALEGKCVAFRFSSYSAIPARLPPGGGYSRSGSSPHSVRSTDAEQQERATEDLAPNIYGAPALRNSLSHPVNRPTPCPMGIPRKTLYNTNDIDWVVPAVKEPRQSEIF